MTRMHLIECQISGWTDNPFKVAERVVSIRLQKYLNENGLQDSFQSAYREMHSVETALLRVQNDILTEMDKGNVVGLILLDLSGAFDTVDHSILEDRLQLTGIGGKALLWFISYLSHRSQAVCVRSSTSKAISLNFSVPQGSVLGPQLFKIYTLPLRDIIKRHHLDYHIYADDTQIYLSCPPVQAEMNTWIARIEACISDIRRWMQARVTLSWMMTKQSSSCWDQDSSLQSSKFTVCRLAPHLSLQ